MISIFDAVSLAGAPGRPNEDRWGQAAGRVWVIDGATGLGDRLLAGESDAAWVAQRANESFIRHAGIDETSAMLARVADDLAAAFSAERLRDPAERWEVPCASFIMLTRREAGYEVAHLGDCRCLVEMNNEELRIFGATAVTEAAESETASGYPSTREGARYSSPEALSMLRAGRALYNQPGDAGVLVPGADFLPFVSYAAVDAPASGRALLMSDGFAAFSLRYRAIDDRAFLAAAWEAGLLPLAERLRAIETREDPDGLRFPRWKRSDDATAVLCQWKT